MTVMMGDLLGVRWDVVRTRLLESSREMIVGELAELAAYDRAAALIAEVGEALGVCQAELAEAVAAKAAGRDRVMALEDDLATKRFERDRIERLVRRIQAGEMDGPAPDLGPGRAAVREVERELSNVQPDVRVLTSSIVELQKQEGRLAALLPVLAEVERPLAPALRAAISSVA